MDNAIQNQKEKCYEHCIPRLVWVIVLLPGIYLFLIWNRLPVTVPMHFDAGGKANGYGSKNDLCIVNGVVTAVSILIYLLLLNLYKIDPRKSAALNKEKPERMAFMIAVFISVIMPCFTLCIKQSGFFCNCLSTAVDKRIGRGTGLSQLPAMINWGR